VYYILYICTHIFVKETRCWSSQYIVRTTQSGEPSTTSCFLISRSIGYYL